MEVGCRHLIENLTSAELIEITLSLAENRNHIKRLRSQTEASPAWVWYSFNFTANRPRLMISLGNFGMPFITGNDVSVLK